MKVQCRVRQGLLITENSLHENCLVHMQTILLIPRTLILNNPTVRYIYITVTDLVQAQAAKFLHAKQLRVKKCYLFTQQMAHSLLSIRNDDNYVTDTQEEQNICYVTLTIMMARGRPHSNTVSAVTKKVSIYKLHQLWADLNGHHQFWSTTA